ncbi:putative fimbrial protein SthA [Serratia quinivorans]|nr:putative fimbrial protein SthA [Serratia quinivorans]
MVVVTLGVTLGATPVYAAGTAAVTVNFTGSYKRTTCTLGSSQRTIDLGAFNSVSGLTLNGDMQDGPKSANYTLISCASGVAVRYSVNGAADSAYPNYFRNTSANSAASAFILFWRDNTTSKDMTPNTWSSWITPGTTPMTYYVQLKRKNTRIDSLFFVKWGVGQDMAPGLIEMNLTVNLEYQ